MPTFLEYFLDMLSLQLHPQKLFQMPSPPGPGASPGRGSFPKALSQKAMAHPSAQRNNFPNTSFQAPRQLWEPKQPKPEGLGKPSTEVLRCPSGDIPTAPRFTQHHKTSLGLLLQGGARLWQELTLIPSPPGLRGSLGTPSCRISLTSRAHCPVQQQPRASAVSHQPCDKYSMAHYPGEESPSPVLLRLGESGSCCLLFAQAAPISQLGIHWEPPRTRSPRPNPAVPGRGSQLTRSLPLAQLP